MDNGASYSVTAGEIVTLGFEAQRIVGSSSSFANMFIAFLDENGANVGYNYIYAYDANNGWERAVDKMVVPDGAVKAQIHVLTYGRQDNSTEGEPTITTFALRNFQFSQDDTLAANVLSTSAQLNDVSFLVNSSDNAGGGNVSIDVVDGAPALIFDDLYSTGSGSVFVGSSHGISGGDIDSGQSYSVAAGDTITMNLEVKALTGTTGSAGLFVYFYDASGAVITSTGTFPTNVVNWKSSGRSIVAPENAVKYKIYIYHYSRLYVETGNPGHSKVAVRNIDVRNLGQASAYSAPEGDPNAWGISHTRYVYNADGHLRFAISAQGRVTEYDYDSYGRVEYVRSHTTSTFDMNIATPNEADMEAWATAKGLTGVSLTRNFYDGRGNLTRTINSANLDGTENTSDGYSDTFYLYDQSGRLLKRHSISEITPNHDWSNTYAGVEEYTYDGMGRLISSTHQNGGSTSIVFNDALTSTTVTIDATGYARTSTYNKAGDLISETDAGSETQSRTLNYLYDQNGRLRVSSEVSGYNNQAGAGWNTYYLYDDAGQQTASVNHLGDITEYRYDKNGRVIATARYGLQATHQTLSLANILTMLGDPNNTLTIADIRPAAHSYDVRQWTIYDGRGQVVQTIDGDGSTTHYAYDFAGRLVKTQSFYGTLTVTSFWEAPPQYMITPDADSLGRDVTLRTFYNKDGRVVGTLNGTGHLSHMIYDAAGRKVQDISYAMLTDETLRADGSFAELWASILPDASKDISSRYIYDGMDNLRYEIDPSGYVTAYEYVATGVLVTGAVRQTISYANALPTLSTYTLQTVQAAISALSTSTQNRITRMVYNDQDQLSFSIDAEGGVTGFIYDTQGRVIKTVQFESLYDPGNIGVPLHATFQTWSTTHLNNARFTHTYYNARGEVGAVVDAEGYLTRIRYDHMGRKLSDARWDVDISTIAGLTGDPETLTLTTIDTYLNETSNTNFIKTRYEYDQAGRLANVYDHANVRRYIEYYKNGEQMWDIVAYGDATGETRRQMSYDASGRMIYDYQWIDPAAQEYTYTINYYDGLGNTTHSYYRYYGGTGQDDYGLSPTFYTYDGNGNILTQTLARWSNDASTSSYKYDAFGNVIQHTDALGHNSFKYYDNAGRLETSVNAEGYVTKYTYNSFGEIETQTRFHTQININTVTTAAAPTVATHALDATTTYTYDRLGRVDTVTNPANNVMDTDYTVFGETESVTYAGAETQFAYDGLSRLVKTTDAQSLNGNPMFESYTLDAYGNRVEVINQLGGVTTNTYDHRGLLLSEEFSISADGQTANIKNIYEYDARGNRTKSTQAYGLPEERVTIYRYDSSSRLIETEREAVFITTATGASTLHTPIETIEYDVLGNVARTTDANGAETYFYYNERGQLTHQISPSGTLSTHTYDDNGNVVETRVYGDSAAGVLGKVAPSAVDNTNFRATQFSYDKLNRMLTSTVSNIQTAEYNGTAFANTTQNLTTQYEYDAQGNIIKVTDPNGNVLVSYYDIVGNKTAQVDTEGYLSKWEYDANGNVLEEHRFAKKLTTTPDPSTKPTGILDIENDRITVFTYDLMGRRITETRERILTYNTSIQENTHWDSTIHFEYNGLGQVTKRIEATGEYIVYDYDTGGRLEREYRSSYIDFTGGTSVTPLINYYYTGLGDLSRTVQAGWTDATQTTPVRTTNYAYDNAGRLSTQTDAQGFARTFSYDANGRVVREEYERNGTGNGWEARGTNYDAEGRIVDQMVLVQQTAGTWTNAPNQGGNSTSMSYNTYGEVTSRATNGITSEHFKYDDAGRVWASTAGDGVWKYFMYDQNGNQTLSVTSAGIDFTDSNLNTSSMANVLALFTNGVTGYNATINATITQYDARNQATHVIEPERETSTTTHATQTTSRTYNAFGDVSSETSAGTNTITYTHNTMGRVITIESPQVSITHEDGTPQNINPTEQMYYDISGRLVARRDANGTYTTSGLTLDTGTLTRYDLLSGTGYDGTQALIKATHQYLAQAPNGADVLYSTTSTGYDIFGQARTTTDQINRVTNQTFDNMGRVTEVAHAGGLTDTYEYNDFGQQIKHWNDQTGLENFNFGAGGATFGSLTAGINLADTTTYDALGRITEHTARGGDTTSYSYNWSTVLSAPGLNTVGGWEQTTTYANGKTSLEYKDQFGHITYTRNMALETTSYTYDDAARLISEGAGTNLKTYTWFNTGALAQQTQTDGTKIATYSYDAQGQLTHEGLTINGIVFRNADVTYDTLGRVLTWTDTGTASTTLVPDADISYAYDANGNIRTTTKTFSTINANGTLNAETETFWFAYDSLGRLVLDKGHLVNGEIVLDDNPNNAGRSSGTRIQYDLAGQRTSIEYESLDSNSLSQIFTGQYETAPYGGGQGAPIFINAEFTNTYREDYTYNTAGQLLQIDTGRGTAILNSVDVGGALGYVPTAVIGVTAPTTARRSTFTYDLMGRQTRQKDYQADGSTVLFDSLKTYNAKGQLINDNQTSLHINTTNIANTFFFYRGEDVLGIGTSPYISTPTGSDTKYALGQVTRSWTFNQSTESGQSPVDQNPSETNYIYTWDNAAQLHKIHYYKDAHNRDLNDDDEVNKTQHTRDTHGTLTHASIQDGLTRNVNYQTDLSGQVITRTEVVPNKNNPTEVHYRFGGKEMGKTGNNGDTNTLDAGQSVWDRNTIGVTPGSSNAGAFRHGSDYGTSTADFDNSYTALNSYNQGASSGHYTAQGGETLRSLASSIYGDASLWYKIAGANGMASDVSLAAGQTIALPAGVARNTYNASTFKPYDPSSAIGDTSPTSPEPPKDAKNCGVAGQILLVVVAVAVTLATSGALAGYFGAAGAGTATAATAATATAATAATAGTLGAAVAGASTALSGGLALSGLSGIAIGAVGGAVGSAVSQGLGVITGIQDKFSWKSVGLAAIAGGIGGSGSKLGIGGKSPFAHGARGAVSSTLTQGIGMATGLQSRFSWAGAAAAGVGAGVGASFGNSIGDGFGSQFSNQLATGAVSALAGAATRSAIDGTNFGDNVAAAIPDVIGQALGNAVARGIGGMSRGAGSSSNAPATITGSDGDTLQRVVNADGTVRYASVFIDDSLSGPVGMTRNIDDMLANQSYWQGRTYSLYGRANTQSARRSRSFAQPDLMRQVQAVTSRENARWQRENMEASALANAKLGIFRQTMAPVDMSNLSSLSHGATDLSLFQHNIYGEGQSPGDLVLYMYEHGAKATVNIAIDDAQFLINAGIVVSSHGLSPYRVDFSGAKFETDATMQQAAEYGQYALGAKGAIKLGISGGKLLLKNGDEILDFGRKFAADTSGAVRIPFTGRQTQKTLNKLSLYPNVIDPRTGRAIHFPSTIGDKVTKQNRVNWGSEQRGSFIKEWYDRGHSTPKGGWKEYDIHHIQPREFGGTNEFMNLVPVNRSVHQNEFNKFWREYLGM